MEWIYLFGELPDPTIKVGRTTLSLRKRIKMVQGEQSHNSEFILLAAVVGTSTHETAIKDYFKKFKRTDRGTKQEYFYGTPVMEYAAWLRGQWWSATDQDEKLDDHVSIDSSLWLPTPDRRFIKPTDDPSVLIQSYSTQRGCLPEPYSWFPNPKASFQDYFTPADIVDSARLAMDGINLDAASHWAANKVHRIHDYFDSTHSAFENDWYGNVWLNPPYGNYAPWFSRALFFVNSGKVQQLCMISPVWAFTTQVAKEFMAKVSAMVLLSPTPKFWGNADPNKEGSNHPHAVVYIGNSPERFVKSFASKGIPVKLLNDMRS